MNGKLWKLNGRHFGATTRRGKTSAPFRGEIRAARNSWWWMLSTWSLPELGQQFRRIASVPFAIHCILNVHVRVVPSTVFHFYQFATYPDYLEFSDVFHLDSYYSPRIKTTGIRLQQFSTCHPPRSISFHCRATVNFVPQGLSVYLRRNCYERFLSRSSSWFKNDEYF